MLSDKDIIYIFKILLNKDVPHNQVYMYRNHNLESLKKHIYKSQEFKDFRDLHLEKIRIIIEKEIGINHTGINFEKFWKELIKLNYDSEKFLAKLQELIGEIRIKYKEFYKKYFSIEKDITPHEIAYIIRSNCSVDFFISTSDYFFAECDTVISNLLDKI